MRAGRVMLDAADGAAIVVIDDPRAALRLAERALTAVAAFRKPMYSTDVQRPRIE